MTTTYEPDPPGVTQVDVTLSGGSATFQHKSIIKKILSAKAYSKYQLGTALTSYYDAGAVATDTGNGTLTPTAEGIIDAVEVSVSSVGVSTVTTGTQVKQDDGGVFADKDSEAVSATANDVAVLPATPAEDDALYIGLERCRFNQVENVVAGTDGVATTTTLVFEYYNGSAWTDLTLTSNTMGDELSDLSAGTKFTWDTPSDWVPVAVDSDTFYWIRIREDNASPDWDTVPVLSQIDLGVTLIVDVNVDGTTVFTSYSRPYINETTTSQLTFSTSDIQAGAFDVSEDITIDTDFIALGTAPQDMLVKVFGHIVNAHDANDIERFTVVLGTRQGYVESTNAVSSTPVRILIKGNP